MRYADEEEAIRLLRWIARNGRAGHVSVFNQNTSFGDTGPIGVEIETVCPGTLKDVRDFLERIGATKD